MKMYLTFTFFLGTILSFAHVNKHVTKVYGNITLESMTYFFSEEINKNLIIGQYAELLRKSLSFNGSINLILLQSNETDFRVWEKGNSGSDFNLTILISSPDKNPAKCLNLIYKAIKFNYKLPKDRTLFQTWYMISDHVEINQVLMRKIERPQEVKELVQPEFFTYYYQYQQFHIIRKDQCEITEVAKLNNLYQFEIVSPSVVCLFDEIGKIKVIEAGCKYNFDKKDYFMESEITALIINNIENRYFKPFETKVIGYDKIYFEMMQNKRVLLYSISTKKLIQDLDNILKE